MRSTLPNDPNLVAVCFNPEQLSRARELKGLTKKALAEKIGKTASAITQYEAGTIFPDGKSVASLSLALGVPVQFFARKPFGEQMRIDDCHFRSLRSVSQQSRRQSLRLGELAHEITLVLEEIGIEFPPEQISSLKSQIALTDDIEAIASQVRRAWGLGAGPIPQLIKLIEAKGIIVLPISQACEEVDAFSTWYEGRPFILLAMNKTSSRTHFDVAHELGHLIMHEDALPGDMELERQANAFGASFLLPKDSFINEAPSRWSLEIFSALKRRWYVGIRALAYRAHKLGRLTDASYRRASIEMNQMYGAKSEPHEWTLEGPTLLKNALSLVENEVSFAELADTLALHRAHLNEILAPIMNESRSLP